MPRTISDLTLPNQSPSELWPALTSWLGRNSFIILTPKSDGQQQVISHWDGALLIRPKPGTCVALREMTGGGTIVFEAGISQPAGVTTVHLEGYVTARGPGWKGKEYDLIPKAFAIAGVLRKRGLLLLEDLQQVLLSRATASPAGLPSAATSRFASPPTRSNATLPLAISSRPQPTASLPATITSITSDGLVGPSLPLLPEESLVGRFSSSTEGETRVVSFNMYLLLAISLAVLFPFFVFSVLARPSNLVALLAFLYPPLLFGGMLVYQRYSIRRKGPTTVFVTNRRIIVDQRGKETSTSMALENVGHVEVNVDARAIRRAGVAWVYVMLMGTPKALVGGGRNRHAAPGVLWVPAVPLDSANSLRNLIVSSARDVQIQLGYPAASLAQ